MYEYKTIRLRDKNVDVLQSILNKHAKDKWIFKFLDGLVLVLERKIDLRKKRK